MTIQLYTSYADDGDDSDADDTKIQLAMEIQYM